MDRAARGEISVAICVRSKLSGCWFVDLDAEMSAYRNSGFTDGLGSRSTQNLAYRALRRINVNIPEAVDTLEEECTFGQESIG